MILKDVPLHESYLNNTIVSMPDYIFVFKAKSSSMAQVWPAE